MSRHVSSEELGFAVFPGSDFSSLLVEHYTEANVREVLIEIVARPDFSQRLKPGINDILSGRALELRKAPPRLLHSEKLTRGVVGGLDGVRISTGSAPYQRT